MHVARESRGAHPKMGSADRQANPLYRLLQSRQITCELNTADSLQAPEYPYPFAIHEGLDVFRLLADSNGAVIGMHPAELNIVMSGDSA